MSKQVITRYEKKAAFPTHGHQVLQQYVWSDALPVVHTKRKAEESFLVLGGICTSASERVNP